MSRRRKPAQNAGPWLPIAPFRTWLERALRVHGTLRALADATGLPPRTLYDYMNVNQYVPLFRVDDALGNASGDNWRDLYTEDDIVPKAKALGRKRRAA